jgi:DNA repair photolyase
MGLAPHRLRDSPQLMPMVRRTRFVPYRPKSILNKAKRPDHWFWTRYSAYAYIGCQHGCAFCYCRERKYAPYDDPEDFAYVIKVKQNAAELLRRALSRAPVDLVFTGDYQPAERKFMLSKQMLEVCRDLGFPVFVLERSPLVFRDIGILRDINRCAPSVVAFSILTTPESPSYTRVREIERLAPARGAAITPTRRQAVAGGGSYRAEGGPACAGCPPDADWALRLVGVGSR